MNWICRLLQLRDLCSHLPPHFGHFGISVVVGGSVGKSAPSRAFSKSLINWKAGPRSAPPFRRQERPDSYPGSLRILTRANRKTKREFLPSAAYLIRSRAHVGRALLPPAAHPCPSLATMKPVACEGEAFPPSLMQRPGSVSGLVRAAGLVSVSILLQHL